MVNLEEYLRSGRLVSKEEVSKTFAASRYEDLKVLLESVNFRPVNLADV